MSKVDDIKKELLALGFDVDRIGIIYWIDAIKYVRANYSDWQMLQTAEILTNCTDF